MHGTTIVGVRKNRSVTIAGDCQVSLGNTVIKGTAQKIRSIKNEGYKYKNINTNLKRILLKYLPKI